MQLLGDLAAWHILALGIFLLFLQFIAREAGFWYGQRSLNANVKKDEGVNVIVGAILGLLAFVLALNLSVATSRTAERRLTSLQEANAIGTSWLQATAFGPGHGETIANLLKSYADERLAYIQADRDSPMITEAIAKTSELQTQIWGHLIVLLRDNPGPQSTALMTSLNTTFDASTAMRFAMIYTIPPQLLWLLLALNLCGMGALGYQFGLIGKHHRWLTTMMNILLTVLLVEIVDLGNARLGNFRGDTLAYAWTEQSFQPIPIPTAP
ncbi:MAG: hypothetical protein DI533_18640 [Cereibacter sphaeroides]|uniref:DUF4239 domain-containing protein n=1 Tax=Cereibacter sphaeroides TaxID=1063 RepID=A0A2W5RYB2_CERSP|nr:MAG: hypothetical protein DI533_18640 [Cereibacter sphaeroides]